MDQRARDSGRNIDSPGRKPGVRMPLQTSSPQSGRQKPGLRPEARGNLFRPLRGSGTLSLPFPRAYARGYKYVACFAGWQEVSSEAEPRQNNNNFECASWQILLPDFSSVSLCLRGFSYGLDLKRHARSKLKRAWPAGAKYTAGRGYGPAKARRSQETRTGRIVAVAHEHICESLIVYVRHAQNIRHVEEIEDFGNRFDLNALAYFEGPRKTHIQRTEVVIEVGVSTYQRERLPAHASARIELPDKRVEFCTGMEQTAARVALQRRDARTSIGQNDVHRDPRRQRKDRGQLYSGRQIKHA